MQIAFLSETTELRMLLCHSSNCRQLPRHGFQMPVLPKSARSIQMFLGHYSCWQIGLAIFAPSETAIFWIGRFGYLFSLFIASLFYS